MKTVIINGSPRTNGFTATILHGMGRELIRMGAEVEYYDLSRMKMSQCLGCCSCYRNGACCIKDDAEMLSEKIRTADALILGSPTYASNVSGYMKLFIDRGHFVIEQLLKDKYCVVVATGENYGKNDVAKVLKKLVLYSGGSLVKTIAVNAPFDSVRCGVTHGMTCEATHETAYEATHETAYEATYSNREETTGERTEKHTEEEGNSGENDKVSTLAKKASEKLFRVVSKRRRDPFQHLYHAVIFHVGIKPFVLRKGEAYNGVTERWKSAGIKVGV